ncbi:iron ABC transporter permease [Selenomonas sputigena]|uniref:Iron ABC transporter permease n=1 Tax=Selenomonas sputigena TaxID=69823 RepID=A0ABV3X1L0_9FIRM
MLKNTRGRLALIWLCTLLLLAGSAALSLLGGRYGMDLSEIAGVLTGGLFGEGTDTMGYAVLWKLRMPRILLDALVGAGLALAGAAFQGIFRNPLVSPGVLGVSSGAAFGAALGILLSGVNGFSMALAMLFGLVSVAFTYSLARVRGQVSSLSLVLSGMIVSAVFSALISIIKYVADPYDKLPAITYWLMGSFANASYENVQYAGIPILLSGALLLALRWRINVLSLGDEEAKSIGVQPARIRRSVILLATIMTASGVMVSGTIGWVGLVIPHICRMIIGVDHGKLLPLSAAVGAIFLILVDFTARTATAGEIPIGILTAIIGAPFFAVLFKRTKGAWQ